MATTPTDHDRIVDFIADCRDHHIAPYPVGHRAICDYTGLTMYRVRVSIGQLLREGRLTKMPAYPDHGVVLP